MYGIYTGLKENPYEISGPEIIKLVEYVSILGNTYMYGSSDIDHELANLSSDVF